MKIIPSIAVICLLVLALGCGSHPRIVRLAESSVVVAFGDSLTAGTGVNIPFIANWPGTIPGDRISEALVDFTDIIPTFADLAGQPIPGKDQVDGSSIAPYLRGESTQVERDWILAMGGQNNAKVSDCGVENEWYFRDRVVRDEQYKLYVDTDRKPQKLIDLQADPDENTDITGCESEAALASRAKFEKLIPSWPERDADPIYTPQPPQPWDVPVTVESVVWKKGQNKALHSDAVTRAPHPKR